ncbi:thiopurine S-methyltransferase [Candidatus Endoriftia persephone]|nr:thiopurine S-methyltransferase [Candidatus Endoriftia persephone]USF86952.1 thiopurine S-methyltransferase [Candidatus Endoriftia persephone]
MQLRSVFLTLPLLSLYQPAALADRDHEAPRHQPPPRHTTPKHMQRAPSSGRLEVEKIILGGRGLQGTRIEVRYRLIDVKEFPAHPMTTSIVDDQSRQLIQISKLPMLVAPVPAEKAASTPPGKLYFWDQEGIIKPGSKISVMVAGLASLHLPVEAGPDYDPAAAQVAEAVIEKPKLPADATLKVHQVKDSGNGLLNVWFSTTGVDAITAGAEHTYVINQKTGEKLPVLRVPRIGLLAPKHLEHTDGSFMVINNQGRQVKRGDHITVVVVGLEQPDVLVE